MHYEAGTKEPAVAPRQIDVHLLGPVRIEVDGGPLRVDTRKATALLAYLVAEQPTLTRQAAIGLLWPELTEAGARGALRRTLSVLRRGLAGALVTDGETITLDPSVVVTLDDAALSAVERDHGHEGPCPQCRAAIDEALRMVRGEFMEGFSLRDAPAFEMWQLHQAERLRRRLGSLFARLAQSHAVDADYRSAVAAAERRVEIDPLDESAWCSLMQLHAWAGERNTAIGVYRRCVEILDRELGVPPLDTTTELMEAIADDDLQPAPHLGPALKSPRSAADDELSRQVTEALAVLGDPTSISELRAVSGRTESEVVAVVDRLLLSGELAESPEGRFAFSGFGRLEEMSRSTPMSRRRVLHGRAAQVIRRRVPPDPSALAHHLQMAGLLDEASAAWLSAARSAVADNRFADAVLHLETSLAMGDGDAAAANDLLGDVHQLAGRYGPALAAYHRAASHRASEETEVKIASVYARTGRWNLAEHHFGLALDAATGEAAAGVLVDWGIALARNGRLDEAERHRDRALMIAPDDRRILAHAAYLSGMIERERGHIELAEERLRQALSMGARQGDDRLAAAASSILGRLLADSEDFDAAVLAAEEAVGLTRNSGDRHAEAVALANMGDLLQRAGRTEDAAAAVSASVELLADIGIDDDRLDPEIWKLTGW